jgi:FkbM family methyltransferase
LAVDFSKIHGRLIRTPLRLIPKSAVLRILQGPLRGSRWIVGSGNHGCWLGSYEHDKHRAFAAAIRVGQVVYDVGAHVGYYTLLACSRAGHVYAFEPLPRNLGFLRRHLELNGIENCTVVTAAAGERDGTAHFKSGGGSYLGRIADDGELAVPVVSLDAFAKTHAKPDVIKMDIEGAERSALLGMEEILKSRPTIFLSTHGREIHEECCALLKEAGYQLQFLAPDEIVAESL